MSYFCSASDILPFLCPSRPLWPLLSPDRNFRNLRASRTGNDFLYVVQVRRKTDFEASKLRKVRPGSFAIITIPITKILLFGVGGGGGGEEDVTQIDCKLLGWLDGVCGCACL